MPSQIYIISEMAKDGADSRAQIPALLSSEQQQHEHEQQRLDKPLYRQRWGWPNDDQRLQLAPTEITTFVRMYAWPKETELVRRAAFGTYERAHEIQTVSALMIVLGTAMSF